MASSIPPIEPPFDTEGVFQLQTYYVEDLKEPFPADMTLIERMCHRVEVQAMKDTGLLVLHKGVWCWPLSDELPSYVEVPNV